MTQHSEDRFTTVLFYGVVFALTYLVFRVVQPFLVPLGWAAIFGVIFYRANKDLEKKWGRTFAASVSTAGVTLILVVPVLLLATLFVREGIDAARQIQSSVASGQYNGFNRAWDWLSTYLDRLGADVDLSGLLRQGATRFGQYLGSKLGSIVRNIVVFVFEIFVMLFALFYFLRDGDAILDRLRLFLPFEASIRERMLSEGRDLIFSGVTTSLAIAAIQGAICGGAFAMLGVSSPIFWGVLMAFLSLLPVVGAWPVWIPAAIYLFSTGHPGRGLILIGICGGVGGTIDNILRPILLGGRSSMNGLLVFISVLGGVAVFGMLGIVLGPIVVATVVVILDAYSGKSGQIRPGKRARA